MRYDGKAALPRHWQKRILILLLAFRFTYIDRVTVTLLLGIKRSAAAATLAALVRDGLLARLLGHAASSWLFRLTPAVNSTFNLTQASC